MPFAAWCNHFVCISRIGFSINIGALLKVHQAPSKFRSSFLLIGEWNEIERMVCYKWKHLDRFVETGHCRNPRVPITCALKNGHHEYLFSDPSSDLSETDGLSKMNSVFFQTRNPIFLQLPDEHNRLMSFRRLVSPTVEASATDGMHDCTSPPNQTKSADTKSVKFNLAY